MTQVNKISIARPTPLRLGDKVTCDLYPEIVLTIVGLVAKRATLKSPRGNQFVVALHRLKKA